MLETNASLLIWQLYTGEAALLTGGGWLLGQTSSVSSTILYPSASVQLPGCSVPSIGSFDLVGGSHVSFLTQDSPRPRITICGGGGERKDCLVLQNGGWARGVVDDLPDGRSLSASVGLDAGVYILGGLQTASSSVFLRANSSSWVQGPQLPVAMERGPCAAPISAHSFLIVYETYVYEFDTRVGEGLTSSSGWKEKTTWPQLQTARNNWPGCGVVGNLFVVAGGRNGGHYGDLFNLGYGNYLRSTEIINLDKKTIEYGGEMEKPRGFYHLLSIGGVLHALGGYYYVERRTNPFVELNGVPLADVEEFDEETGTWKTATSLSDKKQKYGGVAVNFDLLCG